MARKTPEQRLAELERKRAALAARVRADATREKIVIGAAAAVEARANPAFAESLKSILSNRVNRAADVAAISAFLESLDAPETPPASSEMPIPPASPPGESAGDAPIDLAPPPPTDFDIPRRAGGRRL